MVLYAVRGKVDVGYAVLSAFRRWSARCIGTAVQQRVSGRALTLAFAVLLAAVGVWLIVG